MNYDPHKLGMDRIIEDQQIAQAKRDREAAAQRRADRAQAKAAKRAKAKGHHTNTTHIDESTSKSDIGIAEQTIGGVIILAVGIGIAYYGINEMPQLGDWPILIGLVAAIVVGGLLNGPLRRLLVWITRLFVLGVFGGLLYAIYASQSFPD
jgi:hypothetical protein